MGFVIVKKQDLLKSKKKQLSKSPALLSKSRLGIDISLSKISLVGHILF